MKTPIAGFLLCLAVVQFTIMSSGCAGGESRRDAAGRFTVERVSSSVIQVIGYDFSSSTLYIKFNTGHEYVYAGVPYPLYLKFRDASSKGQFFNHAIKNRYPFRCVSPRGMTVK